MRISDWSSDVCSSDLRLTAKSGASFDQLSRFLMANRGWPDAEKLRARAEKAISLDSYDPARTLAYFQSYPPQTASGQFRSEEHTSELQSIMRKSYAVFCWKKTKIEDRLTHIKIRTH